jgi:predicted NBD/HSP70 family sugar kinase
MIKNTNIVKKANQSLVLDVIRKYKSVTTEDIINYTQLSRPTVLTIVKELCMKDIVEKSGRAKQAVGRMPALYSLSQNSYYVMGIDVDSPPIYLTIARLDGETVYSKKWKISHDADMNELVTSLIDNITIALSESSIPSSKILGLGLGLPAVVNIMKNTAEKISRISGWQDICIDDMMKEKFGFTTYVRNDTHLLAHMEINGLNEDILYILHRSGIGMAPIINGEVYEGTFGNSGYIGHTRIESKGRVCNCKTKDCLELYCSKRSIEDEYEKLTNQMLGYDELIVRASEGDPDAISVFRMAGYYFGIGIANAIKTYDIPTVIIGDLRCEEDHVFFQSVLESIKENSVNYNNETPVISLSKYTSNMYGLGGCQYVLDKFFEQPKLNTNIENNGGE